MVKAQATHLTGQMLIWAKQKSLLQAERENKTVLICNVLSFSVGEVFATAKVKLLRSEVCAMHK